MRLDEALRHAFYSCNNTLAIFLLCLHFSVFLFTLPYLDLIFIFYFLGFFFITVVYINILHSVKE